MSADFSGVIESAMSGGDTGASDSAGPPPAMDSVSSDASASTAESPASEAITSQESTVTASTADPLEGQAVPYPRFREVNGERTRYKEQLDRLSWAQAIPETVAPHIAEFYQDFARDPIGTLIRESEALAGSDPVHAQALRSAAARWLGQRRGPQAAADEAQPEPDLQAADGTLVYSAPQAQKLMEWRERRLQQQIAQTVQPLQQQAARAQAAQMRAEMQAKANTWARDTYSQWVQRPYFAENKAAIADLMERKGLGIAEAYADVLQTVVFPKLSASERSNVVTQMRNKAQAGTMSPSRGPVATPTRPKTFSEAMRQLTSPAG